MPESQNISPIDAISSSPTYNDFSNNFFAYQRRRMSLLLAWSLASVGVGTANQLSRSPFWRQFGLQALAWGAIDAALALFSIRSASRKDTLYRAGEIAPVQVQQEVRSLRRLLLINTFLDVGYCVTGLWVWRRFHQRADRRGLGIGILVQGLWLLLFDSGLTIDIGRRWPRS